MRTEVIKIISGGQTGADRGGLDAAIELGIPHGGWCPAGRLAEDGGVPEKYNLQELYSRFYAHRTEQNVIDSDVTLVFTYGTPQGGSKRTIDFACIHGKPYLWVNLNDSDNSAVEYIVEWLHNLSVMQIILNIAGSRASTSPPDIHERVCRITRDVCIRLNELQNS